MTTTHDDYIDALEAAGFNATWEYPGLVMIHLAPGVYVTTGLLGYEYGSMCNENTSEDATVVPADDSPSAWVDALEPIRVAMGVPRK